MTKDDLSELVKSCPILTDKAFLKKYPRITDVVANLFEISKEIKAKGGKCKLFESLGIAGVEGYVDLIQKGDAKAIEYYKSFKKLLELSEIMPECREDLKPSGPRDYLHN